jgi:hypothetical protein
VSSAQVAALNVISGLCLCGAGGCFLALAACMLGRLRADARRGPACRVMSRRSDGSGR